MSTFAQLKSGEFVDGPKDRSKIMWLENCNFKEVITLFEMCDYKGDIRSDFTTALNYTSGDFQKCWPTTLELLCSQNSY